MVVARAKRRESEVEELRASLREHDVRGLEIAMRDAQPMGFVQSIRDLDAVLHRVGDGQRSARDAIGERLALDELHDDVGPIGDASDVVHGADVRMIQARDDPGLALEAFGQLRVGGEVRVQHFDRDAAVQPRVPRLVDLADSARADGGADFVRPEANTVLQRVCVVRRARACAEQTGHAQPVRSRAFAKLGAARRTG